MTTEELFEANTCLVWYEARRLHWFKQQDDLRQVGLLALWDAAKKLDETTEFRGWARKHIRYAMLNMITREIRKTRRITSNDYHEPVDFRELTPAAGLLAEADKERLRRIRRAVIKLPDYRRELLNRYLSGSLRIVEGSVIEGTSLSSTVLRILEYVRSETIQPGVADLAELCKPNRRR